ncbi:MAG: hypothetical protein A2Z35_05865 [Actinobacteria bacterium RBG_19FT_COMBO_36_27]|nr:MAG: hypothetical protein A2Z35_05865 [Actinobacteria bacterium RBG_19FT_COMBO_36_27]
MSEQTKKIFLPLYLLLLTIAFLVSFAVVMYTTDIFLKESDINKIFEEENIENVTRIYTSSMYRFDWKDNGEECSLEIYNSYDQVNWEEKQMSQVDVGTFFKYKNILFRSSNKELIRKYYAKIKSLK